jgi:hypothetical protein
VFAAVRYNLALCKIAPQANAPVAMVCTFNQSCRRFLVFSFFQLKEKNNNIFKRKTGKKKADTARKAGRDVKFFIKNTTRGTRVEIFNKTRQGLNLTVLDADLSLLLFFWLLF